MVRQISKWVMFDFDGVLVDSFETHLQKLHEVFNVSLTADQYRQMHEGNFYDGTAESPLANVDWSMYVRDALPHIERLPLVEGYRELLEYLHDRQYGIGVISYGCEETIARFLDHNDVALHFECVLGRQSSLTKVEKLRSLHTRCGVQAQQIVLVTDTLGDILEARESDSGAIGITGGYHSRDTMSRGGPYDIVNHPAELRGAIDLYFA